MFVKKMFCFKLIIFLILTMGVTLVVSRHYFSNDNIHLINDHAILPSNASDATLQYITNQRKFKKIVAISATSNASISTNGISNLPYLKNLSRVDLSYSDNITDSALLYISRISGLKFLKLTGCFKITDQGISYLSRLEHLEILDLSINDQITDDGLSTLIRLQNLREIHIHHCPRVTDDFVFKSCKFPALKYLDVRQTMITEAGVNKAKAECSNISFNFDKENVISDCNKLIPFRVFFRELNMPNDFQGVGKTPEND